MRDGTELNLGDCRIRSAGPYFPEMFDYEGCGEFEPEVDKKDPPKIVVEETAKKALQYLEEKGRPPARATSATWDQYINDIKSILRGKA